MNTAEAFGWRRGHPWRKSDQCTIAMQPHGIVQYIFLKICRLIFCGFFYFQRLAADLAIARLRASSLRFLIPDS